MQKFELDRTSRELFDDVLVDMANQTGGWIVFPWKNSGYEKYFPEVGGDEDMIALVSSEFAARNGYEIWMLGIKDEPTVYVCKDGFVVLIYCHA